MPAWTKEDLEKFKKCQEEFKPHNYTLIKILGKGGFGMVFEAEKDNKIVALKKVTYNASEVYAHREYQMLCHLESNVKHPYIVKLLQIFKEENSFVFELCNKYSLSTYIIDQGFQITGDKILSFASQLISGLSFLHSINLVHRDIKPDNILINSQDNRLICKISDFGLSNTISATKDVMSSTVGTSVFRAPEIIKYQSYDKKVDVYSLGLTFFYMLKPDKELLKNAKKHINDMQSGEFKDLLLKMTEKDPSKRIDLKDIPDLKWMQDKTIVVTVIDNDTYTSTLRDFKSFMINTQVFPLSSWNLEININHYIPFISFYDSDNIYTLHSINDNRPYYTVQYIYLVNVKEPICSLKNCDAFDINTGAPDDNHNRKSNPEVIKLYKYFEGFGKLCIDTECILEKFEKLYKNSVTKVQSIKDKYNVQDEDINFMIKEFGIYKDDFPVINLFYSHKSYFDNEIISREFIKEIKDSTKGVLKEMNSFIYKHHNNPIDFPKIDYLLDIFNKNKETFKKIFEHIDESIKFITNYSKQIAIYEDQFQKVIILFEEIQRISNLPNHSLNNVHLLLNESNSQLRSNQINECEELKNLDVSIDQHLEDLQKQFNDLNRTHKELKNNAAVEKDIKECKYDIMICDRKIQETRNNIAATNKNRQALFLMDIAKKNKVSSDNKKKIKSLQKELDKINPIVK